MFSLPLLYTMEVWWAGFTSQPERLLVYVLVSYALLLGYNRYAGMRRDASWVEVAIDSIEEMGLGLAIAAAIMFFLGRIDGTMAASEIVGKIVMEAMTVAIGVSVGTAQLGSAKNGDDVEVGHQAGGALEEAHFGGQLVISLCGAVLFAANVAPTEEIVVIAHAIDVPRLLTLAALSMVLGATILFYSEFHGSKRFLIGSGTSHVIVETVITYAMTLLACAVILWFFGRFDGEPVAACLAQTIVLGVAGTLGASAGRLLLQ